MTQIFYLFLSFGFTADGTEAVFCVGVGTNVTCNSTPIVFSVIAFCPLEGEGGAAWGKDSSKRVNSHLVCHNGNPSKLFTAFRNTDLY